jgi:hypothetical protein
MPTVPPELKEMHRRLVQPLPQKALSVRRESEAALRVACLVCSALPGSTRRASPIGRIFRLTLPKRPIF